MALPSNWRNWVIQNLLRGVDPLVLLNTLITAGFTFEAAKKALGTNLPKGTHHVKDAAFYQRLSQPRLLDQLDNCDAEYLVSDKAQLIRIDNFIDQAQCDELIQLAKTRLRPSEIVAKTGYEGFRTSTTCDLPHLNHPAADAIDKQIITCLGLDAGHDETIQAQHYALGQQFKAHTDYFQPGSDEYKTYCQGWGQRTWTFMVYLNEGCQGGETEFVHLGLSFTPKTGTALVWNNLTPEGEVNPNTLHQSHPVTAGEKVVITKWFREQNKS